MGFFKKYLLYAVAFFFIIIIKSSPNMCKTQGAVFKIRFHDPVIIRSIGNESEEIQLYFSQSKIDKFGKIHVLWCEASDKNNKLFYSSLKEQRKGEIIAFEDDLSIEGNFAQPRFSENFDLHNNFYVIYDYKPLLPEISNKPITCLRYYNGERFGKREEMNLDKYQAITHLFIDSKERIHLLFKDYNEKHFKLFVDELEYPKIWDAILDENKKVDEIFKLMPRGRFYIRSNHILSSNNKIYMIWNKTYKKALFSKTYFAIMMNVWDGNQWSKPSLLFEKKLRNRDDLTYYYWNVKLGINGKMNILSYDKNEIYIFEVKNKGAQMIYSLPKGYIRHIRDFAIFDDETFSLIIEEVKNNSGQCDPPSISYAELQEGKLIASQEKIPIGSQLNILRIHKDSEGNLYIIFYDKNHQEKQTLGYIFGEYIKD